MPAGILLFFAITFGSDEMDPPTPPLDRGAVLALWPADQRAMAECVVRRESGWDPFAVNRDNPPHRGADYGLFQINEYWNRDFIDGQDEFDWRQNARYARLLWSWNGWKPWTTREACEAELIARARKGRTA